MAWLVVEKIRDGRPTSVGAASGAVAGLVAITPACAFLTPLTSILLGLLAGAVCALAVGLKYILGYDDALDVVGVHLVGGIIGCLFLGFFSTDAINSAATNGLFFGGGATLLGKQAVAAAQRVRLLLRRRVHPRLGLNKTIGFRISRRRRGRGHRPQRALRDRVRVRHPGQRRRHPVRSPDRGTRQSTSANTRA